MLVYLAAPYTDVENKDALIKEVMATAAVYTLNNPGKHVVSPLFYHHAIPLVASLGSDWEFWKNYSIDLLRRCDEMIVYGCHGWDKSIGVQAEIEIAKSLNIPMTVISCREVRREKTDSIS